jgi:hypothetical protein
LRDCTSIVEGTLLRVTFKDAVGAGPIVHTAAASMKSAASSEATIAITTAAASISANVLDGASSSLLHNSAWVRTMASKCNVAILGGAEVELVVEMKFVVGLVHEVAASGSHRSAVDFAGRDASAGEATEELKGILDVFKRCHIISD